MPQIAMQGWAQATPAMRAVMGSVFRGSRTSSRRRSKRSKAATSKKPKRRKSSSSKQGNRFVKGSAAAKRYMAKLRKLAAKARKKG